MPTRMLSVLLALALLGCADTDGSPDSPSPPSSVAPGSSTGESTVPPPTTVVDSDAPDTSTPPVRAGRCADAPPANGATVTVWHPLSEQAAAVFEGLVAELTEERPDLVVDVVAIPGYDQLVARLREVPSDDLPDLIIGGVNHITALVDSGVTVDPAECAATDGTALWDDLLPLAEATFTVDGRLVGVPYNVSTPVLVYDAGRFRAAGLDPDSPPRRPDELRAATEVMLSSGAAAAGLALYDAATSWLVEQWSAQDGRVLAIPDNGWGVDAVERFVFDTPENVAALEWLQQMQADGLIAWFGVNASGFDDLLALVADRPAAMALHTSASLGDVIAQLEAGLWPGVELGVGPLPGPASGGLAGGGGWWMLDRGDPAQVAAAWAVGSALMEPARLAELSAATGYVPPRRSVLDEPLLQERWRQYPQLRVAYDQLEAVSVDPGRVGLQVGPRPQIQRVLEIATSLMITGEMDASDQLRQAEQRALELLAEYERSLAAGPSS